MGASALTPYATIVIMLTAKTKINISAILRIAVGILWFLFIAYIAAQTGYHRSLADALADPRGVSTQLETALRILILVISFAPSGILFAYGYVMNRPRRSRLLDFVILSLAIGVVLFILFNPYNFVVNHAR